jgi:uncharacterized protein (DUF433 family)
MRRNIQVTTKNLLERITINPQVMVGKPIVRGTRIPVAMILRMLGQGISPEEILHEYPRLERAEVDAALAYAARPV